MGDANALFVYLILLYYTDFTYIVGYVEAVQDSISTLNSINIAVELSSGPYEPYSLSYLLYLLCPL